MTREGFTTEGASAFRAQSEQTPDTQPENQSGTTKWRTVRKAVEIAALSVLSVGGMAEATHAEGVEAALSHRERYEKASTEGKTAEAALLSQVREHGQRGHAERQEIRQLVVPDMGIIEVGYGADGKETWFIYKSEDGGTLMLDRNLDGVVDRIVKNDEERPLGANQKNSENEMKAMVGFDALARDAHVEARLQPEKVFVFDFGQNEEGMTIKLADFQVGEVGELIGEDAERMTAASQEMFAGRIAQ